MSELDLPDLKTRSETSSSSTMTMTTAGDRKNWVIALASQLVRGRAGTGSPASNSRARGPHSETVIEKEHPGLVLTLRASHRLVCFQTVFSFCLQLATGWRAVRLVLSCPPCHRTACEAPLRMPKARWTWFGAHCVGRCSLAFPHPSWGSQG